MRLSSRIKFDSERITSIANVGVEQHLARAQRQRLAGASEDTFDRHGGDPGSLIVCTRRHRPEFTLDSLQVHLEFDASSDSEPERLLEVVPTACIIE